MFIFYDADSDTLQAHTRRYARDRGRPMLVVPDWPNADAYCEHDDCIGARMLDVYAQSLAEPRRATLAHITQ